MNGGAAALAGFVTTGAEAQTPMAVSRHAVQPMLERTREMHAPNDCTHDKHAALAGVPMRRESLRGSMRRTLRAGLAALGVCGMCWLAASCGHTNLYLGDDWGDGGAGGTAPMGTCAPFGQCVPTPSEIWWTGAESYLLWLAPLDAAPPACPVQAPTLKKPTFYEGLVAPEKCERCSCRTPTGACELPTQLAAYPIHPPVCPAPVGTPFEPFYAPNPWDGMCSAMSPIQGKAIQSLMIPPLLVKDPSTCEPGLPTPRALTEQAHWTSQVQLCSPGPDLLGLCPGPAPFSLCAAALTPEASKAGFVQCIGQSTEILGKKLTPNVDPETICPADWPQKHELYAAFTDTRVCSACTCGAPVGSKCSTSISVDTTASNCTNSQITAPVDSTKATCLDVPNGSALLSKRADKPVYEPGMCPPLGGDVLSGGVTVNDQGSWIFCCR